MSLPAGERGLKSSPAMYRMHPSTSLPAGERGLKFHLLHYWGKSRRVAPRRGAWIEIIAYRVNLPSLLRRSPQGSVD